MTIENYEIHFFQPKWAPQEDWLEYDNGHPREKGKENGRGKPGIKE